MNTYSAEYSKQIILANGDVFTFNEKGRYEYMLINGIYTIVDTQVDGRCWEFPMTGIAAILTQKEEFIKEEFVV